MSKYTPRPWVKDFGGTKGHIKSIAPHEKGWTPTVCTYDTYVAFGVAKRKFEYVIKDEEEREANGDLLAAAPDLYEEHKAWAQEFGIALVLYLQGDNSGLDELSREMKIDFTDGSPILKSEAINKAEGNSKEGGK